MKSDTNILYQFVLVLFAGLTLALAAGCTPPSDDAGALAKPASDQSSVTIDSVNYMHERGVKYTLYDLAQTPPRAVGGAIVNMLGTGGEKGCCLGLPRIWKPGMKVRVVWSEADRQQTFPGELTRDLEIPRYDAPADLYVVFYPGQEVELVVSAAEPGHPDWRGRIKKTPWEQCLELHGRKPCKAALPKQFDTESSKGLCVSMKEENLADAENLCQFSMERCMQDFEDEPFCKGILWGPRKK
jgi:hypothetical protein